jgi:putative ABC transport system permease protein
LTNGSDVTVSGIPSATIALELLSKLEKLPTIVAARTMQHGFAYVGNDLQDIYGIDPRTIGTATQLANAYFADGDAAAALKTSSHGGGRGPLSSKIAARTCYR